MLFDEGGKFLNSVVRNKQLQPHEKSLPTPSDDYIRAKTFDGTCPLHLSASQGSLECVAVFLKFGANPNEVTNDATTPLFLAVEHGHTDVIKLLLHHGANVNGPHCWSEWNSLHQASFRNYPAILKLLLDKGANTESEDDFGITPLFIAAQYGNLECLRILISYGAIVNCQAKDRATPLFIAAQEGHGECVELLLAKRADPNLYCNEEEWQLPVHAAAQMGHHNILHFLLPVTDRLCGTAEGKLSPVYSAIYGGHADCLELLLQQGYSPDAQECPVFGYRSPLSLAFTKGLEFILILLKYGVTLHEADLGLCLSHEKFSLFQYFLKKGCKLPCSQNIEEFCAVDVQGHYKEWLPSLLLAGFNPISLFCKSWISSANSDALNFLLEFTDWKRLPWDLEQILSEHKRTSAWVPCHHFEFIPPLSHLCRLEIRSLLTSERLRSDQFIHQLPLPTGLQDYLLFSDVLTMHGVARSSLILGELHEGDARPPLGISGTTERRRT
ncbi:ankyrin repeat and SOCS box protein 3 isoform X2 [Sphaerodactylus townsendi]|uniref:Ankyrin repeat and SOCS box protein 3 n=1 Tax=Sphaerodactylus townsendi TaxID=933632 RepID=A0ACB8G911_9SAUR|nr:ankyrin repeat and SOCS box protein 3 isoform X2 [Sphaerodactylus townsendi]